MSRTDSLITPQRKLANGDLIPAIGFGTFGSDRYTPEEVASAVAGAIRRGYRLIDCAAVYGNETQIGHTLRQVMDEGAVTREDLYITTKVWNDMHGQGDVLLSLARSLRDLRLDYVDAFFVHWPFPNYHAPGCDGDSRHPDAKPFSVDAFMATWRQMERVADMGLARHLGMSNMTIPKLEAVLPLCRIKPHLIEMELHPCFQQPELFAYCMEKGILPIGFCPIGSPKRPDRDKAEGDIADTELPEIVEIAKAHNVHPALICLKWAAQRGQIPIPFSVHEDKYTSNLRAIIEDPLTPAEMDKLRGVDQNCRLIKGQVFLWEGAKGWEELWDPDGVIAR